ncbi:MAG TPA: excinuclease ABC subunit A, partial [Opitutae bacterium]|nr:excinuclease ABC subunit A [Opitutae bacterium]
IQHSPTSGEAVVSQSESQLQKRLQKVLKEQQASSLYLCAPLIRGRKGHHEPLANWARNHDYTMLRIDGQLTELSKFKKLDRYKEHDIDLIVSELSTSHSQLSTSQSLKEALRLGKGSAFLLSSEGELLSRLSTKRTDLATGEAFPELDPKHFSWNSPRGWCPTCRGYGQLFEWMSQEEESSVDHLDDFDDGETCPDCQGARLNELSRAVRLPLNERRTSNIE